VVLTLFGWLMLVKCAVSLLASQAGLRSMALAQRGQKTFVAGGLLSICIGLASMAALIGHRSLIGAPQALNRPSDCPQQPDQTIVGQSGFGQNGVHLGCRQRNGHFG
jgi:hypothetical protein